MFRYLVVPVLMALLLVPDWASAIGRRRPLFGQRAQPISYTYPVQYAPPVYYPAPPVVYDPPVAYQPVVYQPQCQPGVAFVQTNPVVVPQQMEPRPPEPKPKGNVQVEPRAQPRAIEPEPSLKPAAGIETLPPMRDPVPVLPVVKPKEQDSIPLIPLTKPKEIELPALPGMKLDGPKSELPSVPPLVAPAPFDPLPVPNTSKSSPLNAEPSRLKIDRFAVEGAGSSDSLRLVTFYNFSDRELALTIAGRTVAVPSKHSVEAKLPAQFAWRIGDAPQPDGNIPVAAAGLDVVIGK